MKFELRKRRNISDNEYILDLKIVAKILNKDVITIEEYKKYGKYSPS